MFGRTSSVSGTEAFGWIAGAFTTFSFIPQVIRVIRLRSAREISFLFSLTLLIGIFLWLGYGIAKESIPLILWNGMGAVSVGILLYAKIRYGK
jgi:MtN3 and saliva related transmembrane protein